MFEAYLGVPTVPTFPGVFRTFIGVPTVPTFFGVFGEFLGVIGVLGVPETCARSEIFIGYKIFSAFKNEIIFVLITFLVAVSRINPNFLEIFKSCSRVDTLPNRVS